MAYRHKITTSEVPTALLSPITGEAGLTVVFGTSPINMGDIANVNEPVLAYTYAEAVKKLGYVPARQIAGTVEKPIKIFDYTISEAIDSHFSKFNVAPLIMVNVLNPATHKTSITDEVVALADGIGNVIKSGAVVSTVVVKNAAEVATVNVDYILTFTGDGLIQINAIDGKELDGVASVTVSYDYLDPTKVTAADIVGGIDPTTFKRKGLELVNEVFPRFRLVPGTVIAPGFSTDNSVSVVLKSKVKNINSVFRAEAIIDIDTATVIDYTKVPEAKENAGLSDTALIVAWPKVALSGTQYHLSTQLASLMHLTDSENGDVPYASPSNKNLSADSAVLESGEEIWLDVNQAEFLNGNGIVTALNFIGGWKAWGNETSAYPATSDVKERFIPVRRMFNWIGNTLVTTFWSRLDYPLNKRQVETIQDSANDWLNSLVAQGYLLGGRVEFLRAENPDTGLLDGASVFHVYLAAPTPNGDIEFKLEYDTSYLQALFG